VVSDSLAIGVTGLALAGGLVTIAAYFDMRYRRVPNWLVASGLCSGVALNVWLIGPGGAAVALLGALAGLALLLPFYLVHGVGAGDVKLLSAVGALVGPQVLLSVAIYGALVGGVMSLVALALNGRLALALGEIVGQQRLPSRSGLKQRYSLAIASGVYLTLVLPELVG
jgi:prepilin peptidase CpaA